MTNRAWLPTPASDLPKMLKGCCASVGMIFLLSGFTVTSVEFNSEDVPPSQFKINLAKKKGLPAPRGTPGLPVKATLTKPVGEGPFPAVVLFSTAGGWQDTPEHWRRRLNEWGYVTLEVGTETDGPKTWGPTTQVLDAIGALKYLQQVTYVDNDRVAVMAMGATQHCGLLMAQAGPQTMSIGSWPQWPFIPHAKASVSFFTCIDHLCRA